MKSTSTYRKKFCFSFRTTVSVITITIKNNTKFDDHRVIVLRLYGNPRGDSLTFGTGVLMCLFEVGEIIWGLKFRGPKCAICGVGV